MGAAGNVGRAVGGSGKDHYNDRVGEWTHRFFFWVGELLDQQMAERGTERLILIGVPEDAVKAFPARVQKAIVKKLLALSVSRPTPAQVLQAVREGHRRGRARRPGAPTGRVAPLLRSVRFDPSGLQGCGRIRVYSILLGLPAFGEVFCLGRYICAFTTVSP